MGKNVAVFVDVANIFYAAKAAGVDIDYVTLLKSASAGRDLVRAYAYTGLDPDNENQRNFHSFLARNGYRVVSKDIRKYGDGKVKANLDIELVVDMMKTARNLDIAIVVSGDGDFAPAIRAVQEQGVRVEVISFRGNTSSDLIEVADQFADITALARVEKGSSRSGRRVALDDDDLSMTEVPDKQTEGTGAGRGRGRGGRGRPRLDEPAARLERRREPVVVTAGGTPLVVLPGEKLSRVAPGTAPATDEGVATGEDPETGLVAGFGDVPGEPVGDRADDTELDADGRRPRRRRGGRGRGRGRARGEGLEPLGAPDAPRPEPVAVGDTLEAEDARVLDAPRAPRTTPFGSVWDSQLGTSTPTPSRLEALGDDDDFEEPEIPEYLLAERRQRGRVPGGPGMPGGRGQGGRGGGGRGGNRSAYAAAMDRERYGRGGGGGINRYPDVSARERPPQRERDERVPRPTGGGGGGVAGPGRPAGDEPWSEVPPELEAMLRAQLGSRGAARPEGTRSQARPPRGERPEDAGTPRRAADTDAAGPDAGAPAAAADAAPQPDSVAAAVTQRPARRGRRTAAEVGLELAADATAASPVAVPDAGADAVPARRTTRRRTTSPAPAEPAAAEAGAAPASASAASGGPATGDAPAPRRRTRRRAAEPAEGAAPDATPDAPAPADTGAGAAPAGTDGGAAPKRRTTRRKAADAAGADAAAGASGEGSGPAGEESPASTPRRRTTRRKAAEGAPEA